MPAATRANGRAPVRIRAAVPEDFNAIMGMLAPLVRRSPTYFPAEWSSSGDGRAIVMERLEKGSALIAACEGVAIGHIGWRTGLARPPQIAVRYCEIESVFVRSDFRRTDVARRLGKACLLRCRKLGIEQVQVNSLPDHASVALFEALGFSEERRLMVYGLAHGQTQN